MNVKSKTYMRNSEFKERQGSFGFFCARAVEILIEFRAECRKGWAKLFKGVAAKFENITLPLPFERPISHLEWTRRAVKICINTENA